MANEMAMVAFSELLVWREVLSVVPPRIYPEAKPYLTFSWMTFTEIQNILMNLNDAIKLEGIHSYRRGLDYLRKRLED